MVNKNEKYIVERLSEDEYIILKKSYQKYLSDIMYSKHPGSTPIYKLPGYYENVYKNKIRLDKIKFIKIKIGKK